MRISRPILISLLFAAAAFSQQTFWSMNRATSASYYVDSVNGSDSNPGTAASPWQTTAHVNTVKMNKGDSVHFVQSPTVVWSAAFADNFDGSALNTNNWITTFYDGSQTIAGNGDLEWYTPTNFSVSGGILNIIGNDDSPHAGYTYSSGLIESYGKFSQLYGRFEMRAQVPHGIGLWPAFWTLPESTVWPPEIDAMEIFAFNTTVNTSTLHFNDYLSQPRGISFISPAGTDLSLAYHTFAFDWSPTGVVWYLDGAEQYRQNVNIPASALYAIVNMAIGGIAGTPSGITWPTSYLIDYVRIWTRAPGGN